MGYASLVSLRIPLNQANWRVSQTPPRTRTAGPDPFRELAGLDLPQMAGSDSCLPGPPPSPERPAASRSSRSWRRRVASVHAQRSAGS
jgi:hypothetical protein